MTDPLPHASPSWQFGGWVLRFVIALQGLGVGGRYLFSSHETESDVYGWLYFDHGWPEATAQRIDDVGAWACCLASLFVVLGGWLAMPRGPVDRSQRRQRFGRYLEACAAITVAVWVLALAITHSLRGEIYAEWSLAEYAVRYGAPLSLLFLQRDGRMTAAATMHRLGLGLLMLAAAVTFFLHGYKALQGYGPFTDLILLTDQNWSDFGWGQSFAESALVTIGIVDMLVAILLLATRWRWLAIYMAFWGALTAVSRITASGLSAWPETLIRAANWGAPLAIACYLTYRSKASSITIASKVSTARSSSP